MKFFTALVILLIGVISMSCLSEAQPSQPAIPQQGVAVIPQKSSIQPVTVTSLPSPVPLSNIPLPQSLLLMRFDPKNQVNFLSAVDPANGFEPTGFPSIPIGINFYYKLSPDGSTLAAVAYQSGSEPQNASLYLINLRDWTSQKIDLGLDNWIAEIDYSFDSRYIAIAANQANGNLLIVNVPQGIIVTQGQIGLPIRKLKFNSDGTKLMIYAVPVDPENQVTTGSPVVGLLNVKNLNWQWRVTLPGLRDGVYPKEGKTGSLYIPGNADYYVPGLAFSPAKDELYIVNAEKDELVSVDFNLQSAISRQIHPQVTWLQQLINGMISVAEAKGMPGNEKKVLISPDGQYLFSISIRDEINTDKNGGMEFNQIQQGLQIIRIADSVEIRRLATQANDFMISKNGKFLYLHSWSNNGDSSFPTTDIFDTTQGKIIASIKDALLTPTSLVNGQPTLVSAIIMPDGEFKLAAFESDTVQLIGSWSSDAGSFASWFIFP